MTRLLDFIAAALGVPREAIERYWRRGEGESW